MGLVGPDTGITPHTDAVRKDFLQENSILEKGISLAGITSGRGCLAQGAMGTDLPLVADLRERHSSDQGQISDFW